VKRPTQRVRGGELFFAGRGRPRGDKSQGLGGEKARGGFLKLLQGAGFMRRDQEDSTDGEGMLGDRTIPLADSLKREYSRCWGKE